MFITNQQDIRKYVSLYASVASPTIQFLRAQGSTSGVTLVTNRDVFPEMLTDASVASSSLSQEG